MSGVRSPLAVVTGLLLAVTALTACTSDPVPTGVTVGWDESRSAVQVSWTDDNAPNRISIEGVVSTSPSYVKYLPADAQNSWAIPTSAFPADGNYRVAVAIGTSQGGVTSKPARSPMFDTDGPLRPAEAVATPQGRNVVVTWRVPPPAQDFTPGDPLDLPAGSQSYTPVIGSNGQPFRPVGAATTKTRLVLKNVRPPYYFQLRARNEWASLTGAEIAGRTSATSVAVPTLWTFGKQMLIRGRTIQQEVSCGGARCSLQQTTSAGLPVVMLAQNRPGGPWVQAGRSTTQPGGHFQVRVNTGATRSYRAYVPLNSRVGALSSASSSKAFLTRTRLLIQGAGYAGGNVHNRNAVVKAVVVVRPVVNSTAMLQFWNGRAWGNVRGTPMRNGRAEISFRATRPGTFAYRFLVPGTTYQGTPVYGTATPSLVIRVR
ncbi:hypothetical protein Kfla_6441 [Kribbella flavida DSM 17836]|uniref:Fibronectin type III domain protein n=1 Tax=Kribbella flavida (strain DSM 17836 / JCM 10339 / NBRC 14399) TaxID=479435 RepID=D2PX58_KRIFD|nr:hypothetical protein [Kribbella flavida]ADB35438.1 hypothetical protein Kfla_6441 [Kribbella flavida DSM 17836]